MATIFRAPLVTRIPRADPTWVAARGLDNCQSTSPSLLATTLQYPAGAVLEVPRGRPNQVFLEPCIQNLLNSTLQSMPASLKDWPNPLRAIQPIPGWLQGPIPGANQSPFPAVNFDNPLRARNSVPFEPWPVNVLNSTILTPGLTPFAQMDWPNPAPKPPAALSWLQGPRPVASSQAPFTQVNLPNPQRPLNLVSVLDTTWWQNLLNTTLGSQLSPFFQGNWPNPLTTTPRALSWLQGPNPVASSQTPLNQTNPPPNPQRALNLAATFDSTWLQNLSGTLLATPPPPPPPTVFYTFRIPLITRWQRADPLGVALRSQDFYQNFSLAVPPLIPFRLSTAPNPFLLRDRTYIGSVLSTNILTTTLGINPNNPWSADWSAEFGAALILPFYQSFWPQPRSLISANFSTWAPNLLASTLAIPQIRPATLRDWPNPRGYKTVNSQGTWLVNLLQGTLAPQVMAPFSQRNWPLPRGQSSKLLRALAPSFEISPLLIPASAIGIGGGVGVIGGIPGSPIVGPPKASLVPLAQAAIGFPSLQEPFVNSNGFINLSWHRLLAGLWKGINALVSDNLTATGNRQATALQIGVMASVNIVTTVAPGTGVALAQVQQGASVQVVNSGANALLVYPPIGWQIDSLGLNAPYSLASGKAQTFRVRGSGQKQYLSMQLG